MKRIIAWAALLALLLCALAGCGEAAAGTAEDPPQETAETIGPKAPGSEDGETGQPASSSTGEALTDEEMNYEMAEPDYDLGYAKFSPDTRVMTVNGIEYDWSSYFNALRRSLYSLILYYGASGVGYQWSNGAVAGDIAREWAASQLKQIGMIYSKAEELGIRLTEEDEAAIDEELKDYLVYFEGDRDAMFESLRVSEDYYRLEAGTDHLNTKLFEHFFGEDGKLLPEADAVAYIADNDMYYAKHILFKTVDDTGTSLGEEAVAAAKARAEETLETLRAAGAAALPAKFDELMNSLSEDQGLNSYPDGSFFKEGEMVTEFFETAAALKEGELSDVVRSPYGYHIIYRPVLRADAIYGVDAYGEPYTLRYHVADELYAAMQDEWYEALDVTFDGGFETLDVIGLFEE